ncbi:MAG: potassium channel family protein [Phycisphaerae bacterium]
MEFKREQQRVSSTELIQALIDGDDIILTGCTISGNLELERIFNKEEKFDLTALNESVQDGRRIITFSQKVQITNCLFEDKVFFSPQWNDDHVFSVVFKRDAIFNLSQFNNQTRFATAVFKGRAGFDGCKFHSVVAFTACEFKSQAMFRTAEFHGYALFNKAVFFRDARFINTMMSKGGNFKETVFREQADFSGVYSTGKSLPTYTDINFADKQSGYGETFWRYVKQAANEAGCYKLSGDCFYLERCANIRGRFYGANFKQAPFGEKLRRIAAGLRLLPEYIFGNLLFGYGERPVRVLYSSLAVILLFALMYYERGALKCPGYDENGLTLFDSIYFSTITFTTLGFGDVFPSPTDSIARALAMVEAFCGTSFISLFVVSLSKHFSRG